MSAAWRFHIHSTAWDGVEVYARHGKDDVTGITFRTREPGEASEALFSDTREAIDDGMDDGLDFLRAAMNCAWEYGLRPDGFNDTRESMQAKDKHLEDMRSLAFHTIGATKP